MQPCQNKRWIQVVQDTGKLNAEALLVSDV